MEHILGRNEREKEEEGVEEEKKKQAATPLGKKEFEEEFKLFRRKRPQTISENDSPKEVHDMIRT